MLQKRNEREIIDQAQNNKELFFKKTHPPPNPKTLCLSKMQTPFVKLPQQI